MNIDKDLLSTQEVRVLCQKAKEAQLEYKHFNQSQVDKIVKAMVDAGSNEAERLAKMAVEETGFGKIEDKITKNLFATKEVWESIKNLKTVGVIDVQQNGKIVKIAEPMGVVAALIPSTNPTSTLMFKVISSLKSRNGVVASPHPKAVNCTLEAIKVLREAAIKAGAPEGLIQCMTIPTLEGTDSLMKDPNIAVILATGSNAMVKAAYSSGKPAYGVGAGNVPAFIERTANITKAVADIVTGKTFDNGTLCSSEQAIIVDRPIKDKVFEEAKKRGCYFVSLEEKKKLEQYVMKGGKLNAEIVGKSASWIAQFSGFKVPDDTQILVAECSKVGKEELLSAEKLSPILAFYVADGWLDGCHKCIDLLNYGGVGHTMVIHSNDNDVIMKFALEKPAFRILCNTPSSLGAVGYSTGLMPSLTLGCGTWGGSIVSENVNAGHLMNIKTLAFEVKTINSGSSVSSLGTSKNSNQNPTSSSFMQQIEDRLRARAGNPTYSKESESDVKPAVSQNNQSLGKGISLDDVNKIIAEFKF